VIKFIAAALWICAVTIGAVFYSFQQAGAKADIPVPAMLGGLDYVKTEMVSVPVVKDGVIEGYFLTRLVYTVEPRKMAMLSVPAESLIIDEVYSYVYGNPEVDFIRHEAIDLDAFRAGIRDRINKRVGDELVQEVLVEQIDFLTKDEIRDNTIRRRMSSGANERAVAKAFKGD
jgi:hypothetical protein